MYLQVDISDFIIDVWYSLTGFIFTAVSAIDDIIIFNGNWWGVGDFEVTLLDFNIGILVVSIVIGAFVHVNKADNFYSNRKD